MKKPGPLESIAEEGQENVGPAEVAKMRTRVRKLISGWHLCQKENQGGHGTGKAGNLAVNFSRQGKHREFSKFNFLHRENCANTGKILLLKWLQGDGAFLS